MTRSESRLLAPAPEGSGLSGVQGDPGPPYVGYALAMMRDPVRLHRDRMERYGPVSWGNFLGRPLVTVQGPEAAEVVLTNQDRAFASGPAWDFFIGPFFDRGLMLLDFEEHLAHRRLMQQAFTRERMVAYLDRVHDIAERGIGSWQPGRQTLLPLFRRLATDMAISAFVGLELGSGEIRRVERAFTEAVRAGLAVVRVPVPGLRWSRGLKARRQLVDFFVRHIPQKRANGGEDLFAALCTAETEDGQRFSDSEIANHMIFMLMAAHDTSTITLMTMAYHLARHPAWQERCRAESLALGPGAATTAELDSLRSMDLVMRESLRLCAPVPLLPRVAVRDTAVLGYHIPAGSLVSLTIHTNHHMPEHWPDPERFDPERFAPERQSEITHPYSWFPFGGGIHTCMGRHFSGFQAKAVMHCLLRSRAWSVPGDYTWTLDFSTLPVPRDGLPVTLTAPAD
ncbi:cytochrome P450 [Streptomyces sp. NPDC002490]|uniref:cytochrome P450 n=1 Tax=Streptomyces sp. NPDC002490 TaxID=3154416 RepID=UPI00332E2A8D